MMLQAIFLGIILRNWHDVIYSKVTSCVYGNCIMLTKYLHFERVKRKNKVKRVKKAVIKFFENFRMSKKHLYSMDIRGIGMLRSPCRQEFSYE